jgi:hypothetical protein
MPKADETIQLLTEIRDLQKQQLSLMKADRDISMRDKKSENTKLFLHIAYNLIIAVFVIGAFWFFYHTIYGSGLV